MNQRRIACSVTEFVVNVLKTIDVSHDDGQW